MSPAVEAALIAGGVGVLTLIGTLLAQFYGIRRTGGDVEKTLKEQREQLYATLAQQLDRTLNERFATAADQLGSDRPAVQLAGVHTMAGLADDWPDNRQTCVDVLCAYLRLPYDPEPAEDAASPDTAAYRANREVRHTILRLIGAHLREGAAKSWEGHNFDLTGVVFDGGDFTGARFSGGTVSFNGAKFSGGTVSFKAALFSGGTVSFIGAVFSGGHVDFRQGRFSGGRVRFDGAKFSGGEVSFGLEFTSAEFSDRCWVSFTDAEFSGSRVRFDVVGFSGGEVSFTHALFSGGEVSFTHARFSGGEVSFASAEFSGSRVRFNNSRFSGGKISFGGTMFSDSEVDFGGAIFRGGEVDFRHPGKWSRAPIFDWADTGPPPAGVLLPDGAAGRPRHEPGSAAPRPQSGPPPESGPYIKQ
jgi:uncharacterized protein YjbI with pentapeptide repeats